MRYLQLTLVFIVTFWGFFNTFADQNAVGHLVRVQDIDLYYEDYGSGEPLVLLHGFGGCGQQWEPFRETLSKHFRLILVDMRGHGKSTNPSGAFTHRQSAKDVFALLDKLKITRFKAMGISSGGMTLLHMATQQRERIDAMVLIGATHYFPEQARTIMRKEAEGPLSPESLRYFQQCATRGPQVGELAKQFGGFKDSYEDMNFTSPLLGTIKARTLIVHGDRDEFFPVSIPVEMYNAIHGSALWIIPNGDHVPIYGGRAGEFEKIAVDFLQGSKSERK
jgi:pimeloyl-ACP methyl ester carboxylesterase